MEIKLTKQAKGRYTAKVNGEQYTILRNLAEGGWKVIKAHKASGTAVMIERNAKTLDWARSHIAESLGALLDPETSDMQ